MNRLLNQLTIKSHEALTSVLPIVIIVIATGFIVVPLSSGILLTFLIGSCLVIAGMMFFTLGAEIAISKMGEYIGSHITRSRKLWLVILLAFLLGVIITVSEPDLQVLAELVPQIPNSVLIISVALGVGVFMVLALLRMLFGIPLPPLLIGFYAIAFILAFFVPDSFLSIAFDSGGVTTGPMTVPFIMAFGLGISAIRNDKHASHDSFGLIAMCSIGPVIAVLLLGGIYEPSENDFSLPEPVNVEDTQEMLRLFADALPSYMKEITLAMFPVIIFFIIYKFFIF